MITIINSMIFDDHSKLNLNSIYRRSQDDWIHDSGSAEDLSLENWTDNSGLLDKIFWAFYHQVLELNFHLISTTAISITTHLILLCTSTTSNFLSNTISHPLQPLRRDLRSNWLWRARLTRSTIIRAMTFLTSFLRIYLIHHHYIHCLNMNHLHLTQLIILQNFLRN